MICLLLLVCLMSHAHSVTLVGPTSDRWRLPLIPLALLVNSRYTPLLFTRNKEANAYFLPFASVSDLYVDHVSFGDNSRLVRSDGDDSGQRLSLVGIPRKRRAPYNFDAKKLGGVQSSCLYVQYRLE